MVGAAAQPAPSVMKRAADTAGKPPARAARRRRARAPAGRMRDERDVQPGNDAADNEDGGPNLENAEPVPPAAGTGAQPLPAVMKRPAARPKALPRLP